MEELKQQLKKKRKSRAFKGVTADFSLGQFDLRRSTEPFLHFMQHFQLFSLDDAWPGTLN